MKLKSNLIAFLGILCLISVSCSSDSSNGQVPVSGGSESIEVAERIISLSPTATEILFAIGAGEQVVAVDDQSNFPSNAPVTDLSGYTPNVEAIAAYDPDLVVTSYDPGDLVDGLSVLGIKPLIQSAAMTLEDTYSQIIELGELTGHSKEAEKLNKEVHVGNIFSSDLFYDPRGVERFDNLASMGILAVEMEAAGLYGVAAEYEAEALTVVTVSDIIRGGEFKQMSSEEREVGLKTMVEITLNSL